MSKLPFRALLLAVVALSFDACGGAEDNVATGGSVAKDPREVPAPITRTTPEVVKVDLHVREVVAEVDPGKTFAFWTFNGTVPGPFIRAMEGDTVEVTLTNEMSSAEPHNLDFHAAIGPGGGAPVTEVAPGETKTFSFRATRRGAYIYHCSGEGMPWEHVSHGMFGLIQIDPPGGLPSGYKEFYIGQSEWYLGQGGAEEEEHADHAGPRPAFNVDMDKAAAEKPDFYSFNGHTKALASTAMFGGAMQVQQGDKVRLFFVNSGPNKISSFHVIGEIFDRVYGGHPDDAVRNEETVVVPPGSAVVAEFEAAVPGEYLLVDHALFRVPKGAAGVLHVTPTEQPSAGRPNGSWPTELYSPAAFGSSGHGM
jgi:nitrite reductase (NO-forming)